MASTQVRYEAKTGALLHATFTLELTILPGLDLPKDWVCPWTTQPHQTLLLQTEGMYED